MPYKDKDKQRNYDKERMRRTRAIKKENARLKEIGQYQEVPCKEHGHIKCRCEVV